MYQLHPMIGYFAAALLLLAMIADTFKLVTGKRFWGLVAKYHIAAAAAMTFLAALTGLIDYNLGWLPEDGLYVIKAHLALSIFAFVIVLLMANYRYLLQKSLPPKFNAIYLITGGLALGFMFGTSSLGKVGVYRYGAGVNEAKTNFQQTEEYLKKLYGLDALPPPTAEDSLLALPLRPGGDTLAANYDTLAADQTELENADHPPVGRIDHH
jgi:uncharacterized membrane protein